MKKRKSWIQEEIESAEREVSRWPKWVQIAIKLFDGNYEKNRRDLECK